MGVIKKNDNWWIDYYDNNRRRHRQRIGPSKSLAEAVLCKVKTEIAENKFLDKRKEEKILFEAFADEFYELHCVPNYSSPTRSISVHIKQLKEFFSGRYLHEIDTIMVEQFKRNRMQEVKPATVNRALSCLKCLFNRAIDWSKYYGTNPVKKVKMLNEGNCRLRYLEKEEITRLISNCEGNLRGIVTLAVNTGMRRGEIFGLKWRDVDFNRNLIHLYKTKNKEKREVPINKQVMDTLISIRKHPNSPFIFCYKDGKPVQDVRKGWFKALRKSEIIDFRFHDLRHSFASHLVMSGVDLNTVRELLGHKSLQMTLRYSHLSQSHKQRAVDILNRSLGPIQKDNLNLQNAAHVVLEA